MFAFGGWHGGSAVNACGPVAKEVVGYIPGAFFCVELVRSLSPASSHSPTTCTWGRLGTLLENSVMKWQLVRGVPAFAPRGSCERLQQTSATLSAGGSRWRKWTDGRWCPSRSLWQDHHCSNTTAATNLLDAVSQQSTRTAGTDLSI